MRSGMDFLTISGQKWLCGPDSTGALVVASPDDLRVAAPSYFSQESYDAEGVFVPRPGAARFDPGWWSPSTLAGLLAALEVRPDWAFSRANEMADLCRRLLSESGFDVVTPPVRSTLVAFRPTSEAPEALGRTAPARRHPRARGSAYRARPRVVRLVDERGRSRTACRRGDLGVSARSQRLTLVARVRGRFDGLSAVAGLDEREVSMALRCGRVVVTFRAEVVTLAVTL